MSSDRNPCCGRSASPKETTISEAEYDEIETTILEVARYYWQTFAIPESQSWLFALQRSESRFPGPNGAEVGLETLAAVQAMRMSRSSCFRFNNPSCAHCARIVSEHERQFMNIFQAVRAGRMGPARTHAMILCEGNDTDKLILRMQALAKVAVPELSNDVVSESHAQLA
ncbi:MAG: hypothetical protein AAF822_17275 [Pseudomonadota bacterium]